MAMGFAQLIPNDHLQESLNDGQCNEMLAFDSANPSTKSIEIADKILTSSEILTANRTFKAGNDSTDEYIELLPGFATDIFELTLINEGCSSNTATIDSMATDPFENLDSTYNYFTADNNVSPVKDLQWYVYDHLGNYKIRG